MCGACAAMHTSCVLQSCGPGAQTSALANLEDLVVVPEELNGWSVTIPPDDAGSRRRVLDRLRKAERNMNRTQRHTDRIVSVCSDADQAIPLEPETVLTEDAPDRDVLIVVSRSKLGGIVRSRPDVFFRLSPNIPCNPHEIPPEVPAPGIEHVKLVGEFIEPHRLIEVEQAWAQLVTKPPVPLAVLFVIPSDALLARLAKPTRSLDRSPSCH